MILAQDAASPSQGVFIQPPRLRAFPEPVEDAGEVVCGAEGIRMILAQDAAVPG
jgi:hypothetical protein